MTTLIQSPRQRGLLSRTSAVLVSVGLALSGAASTASAAPLPPRAVPAVSGFLAGQLAANDDHFGNTYDGVFYPEYGLTADSVLALGATGAGAEQAAATTAFLQDAAGEYIGTDGETYAGATGKLLVVAVSAGVSPTSFGGVNLVERLGATLTESGRFSDISQWGDYSNTLGQSWAIIGLNRAEQGSDASAVTFLRDQQCEDGGFRLSPGTPGCSSDPDATAMAVQALVAAVGSDDPDVADGTGYLAGLMSADGGIGGAGPTSAANANSTGLAASAFAAVGDDANAERARNFLSTLYLGCSAPAELRGAIAYNSAALTDTEPSDQLRRATAQAAVGLAGQSYVTVSATGDATAPARLDCTPASTPSGSLGSLGSS